MSKAKFTAPLFVVAATALTASPLLARNIEAPASIADVPDAKVSEDTLKCAGRYSIGTPSPHLVFDISIISFKGTFRAVNHTLTAKKDISKVTRISARKAGCAIEIESETGGRGARSIDHLKFELLTKDSFVSGRALHERPDGSMEVIPLKGAYIPDSSMDTNGDEAVAYNDRAASGSRTSNATYHTSNPPPVAERSIAEVDERKEREPVQMPIARRQGRIKFAVTSVLVAPGKSSGAPWDLKRPLPDEVSQGLRQPLAAALSRELFTALGLGSHVSLLNTMLPWTRSAFLQNAQAPDVQVDLYVGESLVLTTAKVQDSYSPTWPNEYTPALDIRDDTQVSIHATDLDFFGQHDAIGTCTLKGIPPLDARAYAVADAFKCMGQLWAVSLRVVSADD